MLLKDRIEELGNLFFRKRINLPFLMIVVFILCFLDLRYSFHHKEGSFFWGIFCLFVSLAGFAGRVHIVGYSDKNTSGRNTKRQKAEKVNTTGLYSIVRHPLYLCNMVILSGFALFMRDLLTLAVTLLIAHFFYEKIIYVEEKFMAEKFKDKYVRWAKKTPMIIPSLKMPVSPKRKFDFKRVLRKEYPGLMVIGMTFFGLNFLDGFFRCGKPCPEAFWSWFVVVIFFVWLTLRTLKKYTKLLR